MQNLWKDIKGFFTRDWTPAEKILVIVCCILLGVVKGFLLAPIKKGVIFGKNSGNVYNELEDEYWLDEEN